MKIEPLIAVLAGAFALGLLYVSLRPGPQIAATPAASAPSGAAPGPAEFGPAAAREFEFTVTGGRVDSGPKVMRAIQGSSVVIRVSSDRAEELHLHGYDLSLALRPGQPGALAFTAGKAGRFPLELHHAELELGALEVRPK